MARKPKQDDALSELLAMASHEALADLIQQLVIERPDVRRECFDILKTNPSLSKKLANQSDGEVILALWAELLPDLSDLDDYGGGDYALRDHVAELLDQVRERLESETVAPDYRSELLDDVLPFIKSGNAGMDDMLYDVAYATCYDDADLLNLAKAFEAMQGDWQIENARCIYKDLGCRDKYLKLRKRKMMYGMDFYDLATFYWNAGEKEKALQVADEGLRKGKGRMDELRRFVADRAKASGNREKYIGLQFAQATDGLSLGKYKTFKKICTKAEWSQFETKILAKIKGAWQTEQLKIRMHRKEYTEALAILTKGRYPTSDWDSGYEIKTAKKLEKRYPEEILKYYLSGLGNLKVNATRKEYARKARVMAKVCHLIVGILCDEERWRSFAIKVKQDNIRRPAFQDEFTKAIPGWRELSEDESG